MNAFRLLARQVRSTNTAFWRNPASAFFTFVFPLLFLVIFTTLLGHGSTTVGGITYDDTTYYVAAMACFGVITACYTNVAMSIVYARDAGILKRVRGTPMPGGAYLGARVAHAAMMGALLVAITVVFGIVAYDAHLPTGIDLVRFLATLLVGSACFAALGLAVSGIVPNADAAPPIVNAIILPLLFLSGIFVPIGDDAPTWVKLVGDVFPVRHFADAMRDSFLGSPAFTWTDVAVMGLWLVGGALVAVRAFRWEARR